MKKITIKISVLEFSSLYQFCKKKCDYVNATDINYVSDNQLIISDFYYFLAQKAILWHLKDEKKEHSIEIPFSTARIIAKDLVGNRLDVTLQNLLAKLDKALVNRDFNLSKYIQDGTQNQVFC